MLCSPFNYLKKFCIVSLIVMERPPKCLLMLVPTIVVIPMYAKKQIFQHIHSLLLGLHACLWNKKAHFFAVFFKWGLCYIVYDAFVMIQVTHPVHALPSSMLQSPEIRRWSQFSTALSMQSKLFLGTLSWACFWYKFSAISNWLCCLISGFCCALKKQVRWGVLLGSSPRLRTRML